MSAKKACFQFAECSLSYAKINLFLKLTNKSSHKISKSACVIILYSIGRIIDSMNEISSSVNSSFL